MTSTSSHNPVALIRLTCALDDRHKAAITERRRTSRTLLKQGQGKPSTVVLTSYPSSCFYHFPSYSKDRSEVEEVPIQYLKHYINTPTRLFHPPPSTGCSLTFKIPSYVTPPHPRLKRKLHSFNPSTKTMFHFRDVARCTMSSYLCCSLL